jgi:hypothetical protein
MITIPLTISWVKEFTCVTSMPFVRTAMTNTPRNVRCGPPTPPDRAVPHDAGRDCIEQESASPRWSSGAHLAREHDTSQATNRAGNDKSNDLIGCDGHASIGCDDPSATEGAKIPPDPCSERDCRQKHCRQHGSFCRKVQLPGSLQRQNLMISKLYIFPVQIKSKLCNRTKISAEIVKWSALWSMHNDP